MTVAMLRSLAKENHIKLSAGIDKAGIIEKLSAALCEEKAAVSENETAPAATPSPAPSSDFNPLGASADVTSAAPSYRQWVSQQQNTMRSGYNSGWQSRAAVREQQATHSPTPWQQRSQVTNHRFGPQSRQPERTDRSDSAAASSQTTPSAAGMPPVSADGYRLGYRAAPQRQGYGKDRGDYESRPARPYQPRPSYGYPQQEERSYPKADYSASTNGLSDSVYRMNRSTEFDNQRLQGITPSLLQPMETEPCSGILEIMPDGFGFLRSNALTPAKTDIYVAPAINRRYRLRTGDVICGTARKQRTFDKYAALLTLDTINGQTAEEDSARPLFEQLTPTYPNKRIALEDHKHPNPMLRLVDFVAPIGYGQRGLLCAPPESGALQLLADIARAVNRNDADVEVLMLLIDAAPELVTEIRESVNAKVFSSTYTDSPENQTRISETMLEYAQRLVENGKHVVILLDSLTKLTKAYQAGLYQGTRPMSNTIAPAALIKPKRFFGSARNIRDGGSLTVIATINIETGNRIDEIIFEEFKGTANMDVILTAPAPGDPIFPMLQLFGSGTKKDDLLLSDTQRDALSGIRSMLSALDNRQAVRQILELMQKTKNNSDFMKRILEWVSMLDTKSEG